MTADKNPIEEAVEQAVDQALSTFVYAPIGLLFDGPARFPKLVRNGRNQVTNARMMGQFAVQMGRTEVTRRATDLDGPVVDLLRGLGFIDGPPPGPAPAPTPSPAADVPDKAEQPTGKQGSTKAPAAKKPAARRPAAGRSRSTKKAAAKKATKRAPAPTAVGLPITDYDSLSASQVVSRLQGLSAGELEAVRSYEAATRGRKTILNRVQQLLKP